MSNDNILNGQKFQFSKYFPIMTQNNSPYTTLVIAGDIGK